MKMQYAVVFNVDGKGLWLGAFIGKQRDRSEAVDDFRRARLYASINGARKAYDAAAGSLYYKDELVSGDARIVPVQCTPQMTQAINPNVHADAPSGGAIDALAAFA